MGIFDSSKSQTSNATDIGNQMNEAGSAQAISLSNLSLAGGRGSTANLSLVTSDYGSIGAALNLTEKNLAMSSAFATDGVSMVSKALNDSANLAYDGLSLSANLSKDVLNDTVNLAFDSVSKGFGFATDVLSIGGTQNLEMLGKVENFSELAANHWLESAKLSDSQARYAMDYTAKENSANRAMLSDANAMVGNAYMNANRGILAFADSGLDRFATMQNEAVKAISANSAQTQSATMKAMDMVFQSTKSPDERTVQDSTKWIMGGLIAVVALVIIAPMLKGKAS